MIVPDGKIENVAATADAERYPAQALVYLLGDSLEVRTASVAVRMPVGRFERDRDGAIPLLGFEFARRFASNEDAPAIDLSREKLVGVPGLAGLNRPVPVKPPPTYEELRARHADGERPHMVRLNVRLLAAVADALGRDDLVLSFTGDPNDAVVVAPWAGDGEALLMPVRTYAPEPEPEPEPVEGSETEGEEGGDS